MVLGGTDSDFVVGIDFHGLLESIQTGFPVIALGGAVALAVDVGKAAEPLLAALAFQPFVFEDFLYVFDGIIKLAVSAFELPFRAALEYAVDLMI